jgi:hypothetical protein
MMQWLLASGLVAIEERHLLNQFNWWTVLFLFGL